MLPDSVPTELCLMDLCIPTLLVIAAVVLLVFRDKVKTIISSFGIEMFTIQDEDNLPELPLWQELALFGTLVLLIYGSWHIMRNGLPRTLSW